MKGIFDENIAKVIKQDDPDIPKYLDFNTLRQEGLGHIGQLSGKIWTDHNVHDPGITILEVLIYALMDLGYRTNLPFEDLITSAENLEKDDNFLTPHEILTVNPVTITDYRKLLLECIGVRNAWIVPTAQEAGLSIVQYNNTLYWGADQGYQIQDCNGNDIVGNVELNGLFKIYIEKEDSVGDTEKLKKDVRELWSKYRNLCEDLTEIKILDPLPFGICAQVEIEAGFDAPKVYKAILLAIREFVQPQLKYYTLKELLDKGKTIDEIFAGRPYRMDSFGFIDTDEFEALEKRNVLYLSDLYTVLFNVPGVRKIRGAHIDGGIPLNEPSPIWIEGNKIKENEVPVFSLETSCIDLYNAEGLITIEKAKIHGGISVFKKFEMSRDSLDTSIPSGKYHQELSRYYSIQNDFPVVYGIGEDGLPDNASLLRKTQALQLKGYLLFYDQLLANYTSQLSNIRSLFSLKPEAARTADEKRTYFAQISETVPGIKKLLKFYHSEKLTEGSELALPVANDQNWQTALEQLRTNGRTILSIGNFCKGKDGLVELFLFPSSSIRTIYINQLIDAFVNEDYEVEVLSDKHGYFFALYPCRPSDIVLVGTKRYTNYELAINESRNVAFLASINDNYNLVTDTSENEDPDKHYFGLNYRPISYLQFIQEIVEDGNEYGQRRKKMLDHLLARFGEDFTDYTLLQYRQKISQDELQQKTLIDQSVYLNKFPEISRNRGKAFNYLEPSWNSSNVSGFEKRVSLLSGINNYERRHLCNVKVTPCFQLRLLDNSGNIVFKGQRSYASREALTQAAGQLLRQLRDPSKYEGMARKLKDFSESEAERLFSSIPSNQHIIISDYQHIQQLYDVNDEVVATGKNTGLKSADEAIKKREAFITTINQQNLEKSPENKKAYRLLPIKGKDRYLDIDAFTYNVSKHPYWKWNVDLPDDAGKTLSEAKFPTEEEALLDVIESGKIQNYLTEHQDASSWEVKVNEVLTLEGKRWFKNTDDAKTFWETLLPYAQIVDNYFYENGDDATFRVFLKGEKEVIAISQDIDLEVFDPNATIKVCVEAFIKDSLQPTYTANRHAFGFEIPGKNSFPTLSSHHYYPSQLEALIELQKAFLLGTSKRNYVKFGTVENTDLSFGLQLDAALILAEPDILFETEKDLDRAINASLRFFKKSESPVSLKKQPNTYTWSLSKEFNGFIRSDEEFSNSSKAKDDFEKILLAKASETDSEIIEANSYRFAIKSSPYKYKFLYGNSSKTDDFTPLFISNASFASDEKAKEGYTKFVQTIPQLTFKKTTSEESSFSFALYKASDTNSSPVAVQYQKDAYQAPVTEAETLIAYLQTVFDTKDGSPSEAYISEQMIEGQEGAYEWKFYKKNDPLAWNPYRCDEKENAKQLLSNICEIIPPIDLDQCPPKDTVICPEKNPNKFHYQVCFEDQNGLEFILISYVGYGSYEEAFQAWEREWYQLLLLAKNKDEYFDGKICQDEKYKQDSDSACDDASFIAVIPANNKRKLIEAGVDLVTFYTRMAHLFPIYETTEEDKTVYKFKVVTTEELPNTDCEMIETGLPTDDSGTLIWLGTAYYSCYTEAVKAYNHFYTLAGIPQNCEILCERGMYFVGIIEVLVESFCQYISEAEAWDDAFAQVGDTNLPVKKDACGDCLPGGVRTFLYASDDPKNFIPVCIEDQWTFKVVSPDYFVATHTCDYNSETERDKRVEEWKSILKNLNWQEYLNFNGKEDTELPDIKLTSTFTDGYFNNGQDQNWLKETCDLVFNIRKCLEDCSKGNLSDGELLPILKSCLLEKYTEKSPFYAIIQEMEVDGMLKVIRFVTYFPIFTTDDGHCYRIYWPDNDRILSEDGLQPCGCPVNDEEEGNGSEDENGGCGAKYPFVSSICYSCCEEAIAAFLKLSEFAENKEYTIECTQGGQYGPYSFQIVDTSKELGYHPQRYSNYQEVLDAIEFTQQCCDNVGMHVLEHILLRPKTEDDWGQMGGGNNSDEIQDNCLLPICPDYCCPIDWYPDMDKDDPCAEEDPEVIHYLPGSDPYSFWATLALPSWAKRFRTEEARNAFEQVLYKEVPALVGLNILWLGPRDMCRFEDKFRVWLDWLQDAQAALCDPDGVHPNCRIVECIKELKSEPPCPTIPEAGGDCDCGNEKEDLDPCCLPHKSEGPLFWGYCEPEPNQPNPDNPQLGQIRSNKATAQNLQKTQTPVTKQTKTKDTEKSKGSSEKRIPKSENNTELLAKVRKRKPFYLKNVKEVTDDSLKETKSYERALFFLNNTPTVEGYSQLVNFFDRYSLRGTDNEDTFLILLQNATWHLFDNLVLGYKGPIADKELESLKESLHKLYAKGLKGSTLNKAWSSKTLGALANEKPLQQITKMLNAKNGK